MKTVFDNSTREELVARIRLLNERSTAEWGKMNVYQMLKHCAKWDDMTLGKIQVKPMLLGKIFGRLVLKSVLKNEDPLRKNTPTSPQFIIKEKDGDVASQKEECIKLINEYGHFDNFNFVHPFFGAMTKEQIGQLVFKHYDHHLRQFGV